MANQKAQQPGYSLNQPTTNIFPVPIIGKRAPTSNDINYQLGQVWIYPITNSAYILTSVLAGAATWENVSGGSGSFSSLTVTPGPISLSGTTTINTTGTAATSIGNSTGALTLVGPTALTGTWTQVGTALINTTGTAATTIGNSTAGVGLVGPSTVTGTLGASGITTVASGVTPSVAGSILEVLGGGGAAPTIVVSAGVPSVTAGINKGSLAINNTAVSAATRLYIFDGTAWQAFTAAG